MRNWLILLLVLACGSAQAQSLAPDQRPHKGIRSQATQLGLGTFAPCINGAVANGNICPGNQAGTQNGTTEIDGSAFLGYGVMGLNQIETYSVGIGYFSLGSMQNPDGFYAQQAYAVIGNGMMNTAIGLRAMSNSTAKGCNVHTAGASLNTVVGAAAGINISCTSGTGGYSNTLLGESDGESITSGFFNVGVGNDVYANSGSGTFSNNAVGGAEAGKNITGSQNAAWGAASMQNSVGSQDNVAVGYAAMQYVIGAGSTDFNTAVGWTALQGNVTPSNDTGTNNTAIGAAALTVNTSGNHNTAIGAAALFSNTTGQQNTTVGYAAGDLIVGGSNNTILGYNVASSVLTTGSNNVLIGTNSTTTTSAAGASNEIHIAAGGGDVFSATGSGTNTTAVPVINGTVDMPNLAASSAAQTGTVCWSTGSGATAGRLTVDTTVGCLSSLEELKEIKGNINTGLDIVMKMNPFWFKWRDGTQQYTGDKKEQPGLGAHAVESIDSRLVGYDGDGKLKGIRYEEMTAVLVAAVKDQQKEIEQLKLLVALLFCCGLFSILMVIGKKLEN